MCGPSKEPTFAAVSLCSIAAFFSQAPTLLDARASFLNMRASCPRRASSSVSVCIVSKIRFIAQHARTLTLRQSAAAAATSLY
eukprot:6183065-Pleurochrysis_carterae.AAC.2